MVRTWMSAVLVLAACRGSERRPDPVPLDQPDPTGDHAIVWPAPLDTSAKALPGEPPLRTFSCTKAITGKRTNGQLRITFTPTTPADVTFRIDFRAAQPACNAATEIQIAAGRLNDGFLGRAYVYRCRRSPLSAFAVSCGPYLGSDLSVLVRGNNWGRTVAFRVPWSARAGLPDASVCQLPFVSYDDAQQPKFVDNDELVFDLADCHLEPRDRTHET